ncbi:MAG TPA: hypothetical protein VKZ18_11965 [Polyangia bacterium]|nr:hypothetical protein [Polyangia bacterium]
MPEPRRENHMAMLIAFRYATGQDPAAGTTVEADSAGVVLGTHHNL